MFDDIEPEQIIQNKGNGVYVVTMKDIPTPAVRTLHPRILCEQVSYRPRSVPIDGKISVVCDKATLVFKDKIWIDEDLTHTLMVNGTIAFSRRFLSGRRFANDFRFRLQEGKNDVTWKFIKGLDSHFLSTFMVQDLGWPTMVTNDILEFVESEVLQKLEMEIWLPQKIQRKRDLTISVWRKFLNSYKRNPDN